MQHYNICTLVLYSCEPPSARRKRQAVNNDVIKADYDVALNTEPATGGSPTLNTTAVTDLVIAAVEDIRTSNVTNVTIAGQQIEVQAVAQPIVIVGMYG